MIQPIYDQALCTACGACAAICPKDAIQMRENAGGYLVAQLDAARCIKCGKCLQVCPSVAENSPIDKIYETCKGSCLSGAIGYATDLHIRREGQSGGLVTALLLYLLETGKIDAAVTNSFCPGKNRPMACLATNKAELLDSTGSYYTQTAVAETVLENADKRLAAVVLGCQARALRLAEHQGRKSADFLIGLVCAGENSGAMIDYLSKKAKIPQEEHLKKFRFRYSHPAYGGWPGNVFMITDRRRYTLGKQYRLESKMLFESYRCLLCYDQMNADADLVCGDPWGIPGDHTEGKTVVIARTEKGRQLLRDAMEAGYVQLDHLPPEQIMNGQTVAPRHIQKVYSGYQACTENHWKYPYCLTENAEKEASQVPQKVYRQYLTRMRYTRERFLSVDPQTVENLTTLCRKRQEKANRRQEWKRRFLLPIRVIRYVSRKLR